MCTFDFGLTSTWFIKLTLKKKLIETVKKRKESVYFEVMTIELTSSFAFLNTKLDQVYMPIFNSKMQWEVSFTVHVEQKDHSTNWNEFRSILLNEALNWYVSSPTSKVSGSSSLYRKLVFPTPVYSNPILVFLSSLYYPKPVFFQPTNSDILKNLELLLHSNTIKSHNTEVCSDWNRTFELAIEAGVCGFCSLTIGGVCYWSIYIFVQLNYSDGSWRSFARKSIEVYGHYRVYARISLFDKHNVYFTVTICFSATLIFSLT